MRRVEPECEGNGRGIGLAVVSVMSGSTASQALHDRFEAIRQAELERLKKKLGGLTEADRQFIHQITTDGVDARAGGPKRALAGESPSIAVEALVRLFALEA